MELYYEAHTLMGATTGVIFTMMMLAYYFAEGRFRDVLATRYIVLKGIIKDEQGVEYKVNKKLFVKDYTR